MNKRVSRSQAARPLSADWFKHVGKVIWQAGKDLCNDNGPQWAASIAYYALLSLFPLLLGIASVAAFFVNPEWLISQATEAMGDLIPAGEGQIEEIVQSAIDARRGAGILSILSLLWTGTRVFAVLTRR
ncbi:MAG: YhjD/YihY/BrkB family envelope integrity protein [Anaerolineae bacterium]